VVSSLAVLPWPTPVIDPLVFALADATAPSCIDATLRVTDATNCSAEPVACTTSTTACVPVPLRLSDVPAERDHARARLQGHGDPPHQQQDVRGERRPELIDV
jgi:hypothetical protein